MKETDIKTMEGEMLETDILQNEQSPLKTEQENPKFKKSFTLPSLSSTLSKLAKIKKILNHPKILITSTLLLLIILVSIAFYLLMSNNQQALPIDSAEPSTTSPTPPTDNDLQSARNDVQKFSEELKMLETDLSELEFPKVELNLEF